MSCRIDAKILAAAIPYAAVLVGMYWLGSAWIAMSLYYGGALCFMVLDARGLGWRRLFRGWHAGSAVWLVVACAASGPLVCMAWPRVGLSSSSLAARMAEFGVHGRLWVPLVIYFVSVTPWLEELFWRGHLGNQSPNPVAADFLFAGYHVLVLVKFVRIQWVVPAFLALAGLAWIWRRVCGKRRGLLIPALSHMIADASTMGAVYFMVR